MRRRRLLSAAAVLAMTSATTAQEVRKARLAVVIPAGPIAETTETGGNRFYRAFIAELRRLGHAEDRNLVVERWSGGGATARYPLLAKEVVASKPDVIFVVDSRLGAAMLDATRELPIVLAGGNLSGMGLVKSLAHPGGNLTGVSIDDWVVLLTKRLELLREAVPGATRVAYLGPYEHFLAEAARLRGLQVIWVPLLDPIGPDAYRRAFAALAANAADLLCPSDIVENLVHRALIVGLAGQHRLPAIYAFRDFVEIGGLMSYGTDLADLGRLTAGYVVRVLKGEQPAAMPVQVHDKFELVINLKTAKTLGLAIPQAILARADETIE
jgi:putative ABC transport system substrate-binding protein